jgi:uncharacterized protein
VKLSARYRSAFVTGAGSGLGAAFVGMLLQEGVAVWGTARDPVKLPPRAGFAPVALELGDRASIEAAWARAEAEAGGIELLINNAGGGVFGPFSSVPADEWERLFDVLTVGPAHLLRLASVAMAQRGCGCIVNVTSLAVELPIPLMSAYNAGKAALAALCASLELEAATRDLTVVDFRPGDYRTNFNQKMAPTAQAFATDPARWRVWQRMEALMAEAPAPERAARDLRRALRRGRSGIVRSGSFFQAVVAPWFAAVAPSSVVRRLQRRYYRLGS